MLTPMNKPPLRIVRPVEWIADRPPALLPGRLRFLDQTLLPGAVRHVDSADLETVWLAIRTLQVRGAPAIGIAAAMGLAAYVGAAADASSEAVLERVEMAASRLATARPTAVNLFWALDRMRATARRFASLPPAALRERLAVEAVAIRDEDARMCRAIGEHGAALLTDGDTILTHCNAGSLATSELGTALAPVYVATEQGKRIHVIADETRPLLQGARLTAWELCQAGIPVTLICDNVAAHVMKRGGIRAVFVGADRIAANGDTANKIGTYGVAMLARAHGIPFYVLAPSSTFDGNTPDGAAIPIEERAPEEVTQGFGPRTAPEGVAVYCPAFDVTPAALITGFITERGVMSPEKWEKGEATFQKNGGE